MQHSIAHDSPVTGGGGLGGVLSRVPLSVSAPVVLAIPVLVVATVLSTISWVDGRASASRLAVQELSEVHDRIQDRMTALLDVPVRMSEVNAGLIEAGLWPVDDIRSWRRRMADEVRAFDVISAITWGDVEGRATWVARYAGDDYHTYAIKDDRTGDLLEEYVMDGNGALAPEPKSSYAYDPRVRPWYTSPERAGRAIWSEPFAWIAPDGLSSTLGISYGQPIAGGGGELIGVLDAELSLDDISVFLARLQIARTGMAYVVDQEGRLVASSVGEPIVSAEGDRVMSAEAGDQRIGASAATLAQRFGSFAAVPSRTDLRLEIADEPSLVIASPFAHAEGVRWMIVTVVPEHDFLAGVDAARTRSMLWGGVAVLVTVLLGVLLAMAFVRPVLRLAAHVRRIGEGELDAKIELRTSPELARLSREINEMTDGLQDRMRLRQSLALAMEVQQNLLPAENPTVKGLDIAGHSTYCDETGGDYFDFLDVADISESTAVIALGDVMGHGVAAALLMATARGILRSRSREEASLGDLLGHMNDLLVQDTAGQRFMTMLLMLVDVGGGSLSWASAGHDPPFIYDPREDAFVELDGGGLPLGIVGEEHYEQGRFAGLRPGMVILAATDGVWEARNAGDEQFGKQRVQDVIRAHAAEPAESLARAIREAVSAFAGESPDDDVTFVVARVLEVDSGEGVGA